MKDSVRFAMERTMTEYDGHLCSKSSFVDKDGNIMGWHDFGNLEGPGRAANAVGGAYELLRFARHHQRDTGFLTEGVDWNNHVGKQHHFNGAEFGDIQYTEPLLNNLHVVEPTLLAVRLRIAD